MKFGKAKYTQEQIKEIKGVFKKNDITKGYPLEPKIGLPSDTADIFTRAKKIFAQYWQDNLKDLGINQSMKNYSDNYPVNLLMNTDGNMISETIAGMFDTRAKKPLDDYIEVFCGMYQEPLMTGLEGYAKKHGKTTDDLTDEEIMFVIDKICDIINEEQINVLMIGQQVPELFGIAHANAVLDDFSEKEKENHPKIDFLRKEYGLRRKFDCVLSFEELSENDLVGLGPENQVENISDSDFEKILSGFPDTLDETDRTICSMKMDGKTQEEIARTLGYKNHSAVTKRMAKIKDRIPAYIEKLKL